MHEVHRPTVIDRLRHSQRLGLLTHDAFARLDSQVQLQLAINPVHPLVIPAVAFHVAQVQEAQAETPVALVVRKPDQVVGDLGILRGQPRLVAIAGNADLEGQTRLLDTDPARAHRMLRHLSPPRWLHHFFAMASWIISALRRSSAYIFLSRRFSSSNSRSRAINEASIPPNLARHL